MALFYLPQLSLFCSFHSPYDEHPLERETVLRVPRKLLDSESEKLRDEQENIIADERG